MQKSNSILHIRDQALLLALIAAGIERTVVGILGAIRRLTGRAGQNNHLGILELLHISSSFRLKNYFL